MRKYVKTYEEFLLEDLSAIYDKYYKDINNSEFEQIVKSDPTTKVKDSVIVKMGIYSKWLLKLYKTDKLKLEDLYKALNYLQDFDTLKNSNKITNNDINKFKSLPELKRYLDSIGGKGTAEDDENYLVNDRYYINNGEAELFFEDDTYLIVVPNTLKASQFYAHNTEWCTRFPDKFAEYTAKSPLYIIIMKKMLNGDNYFRRMQFHFGDSQFMNMNDEPVPASITENFVNIFKGHEIKLKYDVVYQFYDGIAQVLKGPLWGYIDESGNEITDIKYDNSHPFRNGTARVRYNGRWGLIDTKGKVLIPYEYQQINTVYPEGYYQVKKGGLFGMVDINNNIIVPIIYDMLLTTFSSNRAPVRLNKKYGYIDTTGKLVIPIIYDTHTQFFDGKARVSRAGEYFDIDVNGVESPINSNDISTIEEI